MNRHSPFDLKDANNQFDLSHGFLPPEDPLQHLPDTCHAWEQAALQLPKLLVSDQTQQTIEQLPAFDLDALSAQAQLERAMVVLSYLGHAYIWSQEKPSDILPARIAVPWYEVAKAIGREPVLSYASYALYNWRRFDSDKPIELGNIALLQNFLGGIDEEWFILIHIDIENKAKPALQAALKILEALKQNDLVAVTEQLKVVAEALENVCESLERMTEHCDPYIYYNRVRPYIHGWNNNPALPNGLLYEGVDDYQNEHQQFKGETGAQSTIIPTMDALLGIAHEANPLKLHLDEMRQYMPPQHLEFLKMIEQSNLRDYLASQTQATSAYEHYNNCIELVTRFRRTHLSFAAQYIQQQSQISDANPTAVGTGGTPFMEYLGKHLNETERFKL